MTRSEIDALVAGTPKRTEGYVLVKRGLYWRPLAQGYTGLLAEAGIYSEEESAARVTEDTARIPAADAEDYAPSVYRDVVSRDLNKRYAAQSQTVSALCTALLESMDRVEELEWALKEFDRYSLVIESAVRTCDPIRRPEVLAALRAARKSLGGSNER